VHTYRGIFGSHMAQVFRRFQRICALYGAAPAHVFCSATIADPAELARQLTGLKAIPVLESGAPRGKKHLVFLNTRDGGVSAAIKLLKAALHRELRTIVYTRSRKLTELIALWAGKRRGRFAGRIGSYRAGFLPEERREIERKLSSGELLAVISTSALELGIDIGDLDLCLLVGYPGSVAATWQRGGRVGRGGQESALVLIAGEDALDQYFMRNPRDFLNREPEAAVVNPLNPRIMSRHLVCAAAESPLSIHEPLLASGAVKKAISSLEARGRLLRSKDGETLYANRKAPHRRVDLRGAGVRYRIISADTDKTIGEIDGFRVFKETHPGAVYLHDGVTYRVDALDTEARTVKASRARVDYYTKIRSEDSVEILETIRSESVWGTVVHAGRIRVTDQVVGYEQWRIRGREKISVIPLDLPPQVFETEGLWFEIPRSAEKKTRAENLDVMGGIHAIEHGAIGIFPLLVMADRNDLGGLAAPFQPQLGSPAIFIYDGIPGGAGLAHEAFRRAPALLEFTLKTIDTCPCETGCPSCVHSPKCGSGNRPIDKAAAIFMLNAIKRGPKIAPPAPGAGASAQPSAPPDETAEKKAPDIHFGVLDLETQRSAQEVGGWLRADRMGVSCVVVYDSRADDFFEFTEERIPELVAYLNRLDLIVGFNIKRFDYHVLAGYSDFPFEKLPTLDLLERVHACLGFRLSLDRLARVTLGAKKSADGLQALRWWKQGRLREIIDYCKKDVEITRDLYLFGRKNGHILFKNKEGRIHRIPADW
ncbi:MAG: DUF1998 domain-containing protein, partial [Desulfobacterales bacterium]|nr:DUF1998 domain-containing protein [Desulfobacterales bacterium]